MKNSISIFLVITFILAACTSTPQATMTPEATVTSTPLLEAPIPQLSVEMPEIESQGFTDDLLTEKLQDYENSPLYSYGSDHKAIILEGMEKPTGKAAFSVGANEYISAFGVNGESWIIYKDGERYVATEYDNLRLSDGSPIENAVGYHLYIDPETRQIAEEITSKTWRVPAFSILTDPSTGGSLLLHFDYHDLLLGDEGFKQVVKNEVKADAMLSLVSPELLKDIQTAPKFVSEINFEGDWKVVFDDEGNIVMIDVSSGEELGSFERGKWKEPAPSAEQVWEKEVKEWGLDPEKFTPKYSADGTMVIYDNETNKPVYAVGTGVKTETGEEVKLSGHWELSYAKEMIANSGMCYKNPYVGASPTQGPSNSKERESWWNTIALPLGNAARAEMKKLEYSGNTLFDLYLGGDNNCWAVMPVKSPKGGTKETPKTHMFTFDLNKKLVVVPVYDGQYIDIPVVE